VQFQKDEQLYERTFAESFLNFYRNRTRFSDWQTIIVYPTRSVEQINIQPYRTLINCDQVHRIYLDELGEIRSLPLWVALMVLTITDQNQAPDEARYLLKRNITEQSSSQAIIELVTTIMVYKFEQFSQRDIEIMLGITLQETRVYREIKAEGREEEAVNLVIRQLTKRFGDISEDARNSISRFPLSLLEELSEALLDFTSLSDLKTWMSMQ
jgi:predicted transposase YdaD